ncbi:MAG: DUF2497 domain-containing protein [Novosphingobium sp.]
MRQVSEPSVEEILESIKKVIARDGVADVRPARAVVESNSPASRPADDVLDLSESAQLVDELSADASAEDLLTSNARESMRESFAALSMMAQPSVPPQIVRSGETSLEGMVRELLRPALAEWLDKNLPPLVERMISAEIARIVGKKG